MNGEARILQPNQPIVPPNNERETGFERKIAMANDAATPPTATTDLLKTGNRFARLKRHPRRRSASII